MTPVVRLRLAASLLLALLAVPATAHAGFFAAETVDGPSPDVLAVGDVDISRDAGGALVYLKREGGVAHVFLSVLTNGAFGPGARVDAGLPAPASQPVVAATNEGRVAVAWVSDGVLFTAVRARGAEAFTAPAQVAAGGVSNPSIDLSIHGVAVVTWVQGGDVRAARAERDSPTFAVIAAPADLDPARDAGTGPDKRPKVSVSADGNAVVVWGEDGADGRTHVVGRRIFEGRLSAIVQDLTLPGPGAAVRPDVEMEDDSSFAQVVFTQGGRIHARRLVGSQFEAPLTVDAGAGTVGRVDLTGRGEGLVGVEAGGTPVGTTLWDEAVTSAGPFGSASLAGSPVLPAVGENEEAVLAWVGAADASIRAKHVDGLQKPVFSAEAPLSTAPVDPAAGIDAAATRLGDTFVAFVQGAGAARRVVTGVYDRPPSRPALSTGERLRGLAPLKWGQSFDVLGVTYSVVVDGRAIGTSRTPSFRPTSAKLRDGRHRWHVVATDRRGQRARSSTRTLRIDGTPPVLRARFRRSGSLLTVSATAGDSRGSNPSGLSRTVVDLGDRRVRFRGSVTVRIPRGVSSVTVIARDRAGNATRVRRAV